MTTCGDPVAHDVVLTLEVAGEMQLLSAHSICFCGEIKNYQHFLLKKMSYLELYYSVFYNF